MAGYKRWSWGGGLLNVYSVAGSRAYFTLTWVSLYDTPEDAKARVENLKDYDRNALNAEIDDVIQELQLPVRGVNVISVRDADAPQLGDYAVGKEYTFSGSTAIIDGARNPVCTGAHRRAGHRRRACSKKPMSPPPAPSPKSSLNGLSRL